MSRKLGDWIEAYLQFTENSEPPVLYHEWVAISVIASALRRKCYLPWGHLTFYPNMYIVLVGPSGKCKKGTAMGFGASFLSKLGIKIAANSTTRESLIQQLNAASDNTIDPVTGAMEMHASLTVYSQELTVFLGYNNNQLIMDLTDWYDCHDRWTYRTKNQGIDEIIGVWLNMIGATTPELVQSALPKDAVGGGLASRMIFVYESDKRASVPFPFLSDEAIALHDDLRDDLELMSMMAGPFKYTSDFLDLYGDWYIGQEQNPPFQTVPSLSGYVQRRPNHIFKLCIILSAATRDDRVVDARVLRRAIDLLERTELNMPRTFAGYGASPDADITARIMAFLEIRRRVTRQDLVLAFHQDLRFGVLSLDRIIDIMVEMGFCKREIVGATTYIVKL